MRKTIAKSVENKIKKSVGKKKLTTSLTTEKEKKVIQLPFKIFLIGFMGSGKSHWGRIWAKKMKIKYFDLDTRIEKAFKMKIADIFEKKGEDKFRELEMYHLRKFENKKDFLLACGGGTPCFSDNLEWMKSQGKVFYLKATPEVIMKNLINETKQRPLLKEINRKDLLLFIQHKLIEREPYYSKADFILNTENLNENSLPDFLK